MTIQPTGNRVLILPDEAKCETESGFILPADAQERPVYGEVIMVGPDCRQVKQGDRAIFLRKSGVNPMVGGKEHIIMVEGDVLGVIEEESKKNWKDINVITTIFTPNTSVAVITENGRTNYRIISATEDTMELLPINPENLIKKLSIVAYRSMYGL